MLFVVASCKKDTTTTNNDPAKLPDDYSNKSTGTSAHDILSASTYDALNIEIHNMPGYELSAGAILNLKEFLEANCYKPGGITITGKQINGNGNTLTIDNIKAIEKLNRTNYTSGSTLQIYILVTDGNYSEAGVLGIAYRNTSVCLMGKTIFDNSGGIGQASRIKLETTVLKHELGHLLGLVGIGSPMQVTHKDDAHGNHCNNTSCLMYYASETTDILGFLLTSPSPELDVNCKADLVANGGKP
jgi:hypothetical protein